MRPAGARRGLEERGHGACARHRDVWCRQVHASRRVRTPWPQHRQHRLRRLGACGRPVGRKTDGGTLAGRPDLVVSGTVLQRGDVDDRFEQVVLLSAPVEVLDRAGADSPVQSLWGALPSNAPRSLDTSRWSNRCCETERLSSWMVDSPWRNGPTSYRNPAKGCGCSSLPNALSGQHSPGCLDVGWLSGSAAASLRSGTVSDPLEEVESGLGHRCQPWLIVRE